MSTTQARPPVVLVWWFPFAQIGNHPYLGANSASDCALSLSVNLNLSCLLSLLISFCFPHPITLFIISCLPHPITLPFFVGNSGSPSLFAAAWFTEPPNRFAAFAVAASHLAQQLRHLSWQLAQTLLCFSGPFTAVVAAAPPPSLATSAVPQQAPQPLNTLPSCWKLVHLFTASAANLVVSPAALHLHCCNHGSMLLSTKAALLPWWHWQQLTYPRPSMIATRVAAIPLPLATARPGVPFGFHCGWAQNSSWASSSTVAGLGVAPGLQIFPQS